MSNEKQNITSIDPVKLREEIIAEAKEALYPLDSIIIRDNVRKAIRDIERFMRYLPKYITPELLFCFGKLCIAEGRELYNADIAALNNVNKLNEDLHVKTKKEITKLKIEKNKEIAKLKIEKNVIDALNRGLESENRKYEKKLIENNQIFNKIIAEYKEKNKQLTELLKRSIKEKENDNIKLKMYVEHLKSENQEKNDLVACYKKNESNDTTKEKDDEYRNRYIEIEDQYIEKEQQYKKEIRRLKTNLYYIKYRSRKKRKEANSLKRKLKKNNKEN